MGPSPRVSIIVPFLNAGSFLQAALDGILSQTFQSWEALLVDDGSTDRDRAIAERFLSRAPSRITVLEHPARCNRGLAASRNAALRGARGEFVALLDADDVWIPEKLERQVALLDAHPEAGWLYGSPRYWYGWTGRPEDLSMDAVPGAGIETEVVHAPPSLVTRLYPLSDVSAPCPSDLFLRRAVLTRVGGFENAFSGALGLYEDQALLVKLYLTEAVYVSSECWTWYRVHPGQMTSVFAGRYLDARRFFLEWFAGYLRDKGIEDPAIRSSLRRSLWPYRHPTLWKLSRWLRLARGLSPLAFPPGP